MTVPTGRTDRELRKDPCVVCGASLAHAPTTVTVVVRSGSARETIWTSCACGAICRSERVRNVAYLRSRMPDSQR